MKNNILRKAMKLPFKVNSNEYWFDNFKPDIEADADRETMPIIRTLLLNTIYSSELNINYSFNMDSGYNTFLKKELKANVFFLNTTDYNLPNSINTITLENIIIKNITDLCKVKIINNNTTDNISSLQLNLDTGDTLIFIFQAENSGDLQCLYEYDHISPILKDIDYADFYNMYSEYINIKLKQYKELLGTIAQKTSFIAGFHKQVDFRNQIVKNPSQYFWYYNLNNFTPDMLLKDNESHLRLIKRIEMEFELSMEKNSIVPIYPMPKEISNTHLYFIEKQHQEKYIAFLKDYNIVINDQIWNSAEVL